MGRYEFRTKRLCRTTCQKITTRQGTLDDIQDIAAIESDGWSYQQIHDELTRKVSRVLVAEKMGLKDKTNLVGWIAAWGIPPFELQIIQVTVAKEYQRQGIGYQLLSDLLMECDCEEVILEVREDNTPAIELYKKTGFVTYGERKMYYKDGTSACLMRKEML